MITKFKIFENNTDNGNRVIVYDDDDDGQLSNSRKRFIFTNKNSFDFKKYYIGITRKYVDVVNFEDDAATFDLEKDIFVTNGNITQLGLTHFNESELITPEEMFSRYKTQIINSIIENNDNRYRLLFNNFFSEIDEINMIIKSTEFNL